MDCQIRIRTDELFSDILYIKDWIEHAREGFAFNHCLPDNNHFHIYLFGLDRHPDAMRRTIGKYLPKQNYSVSKTAGKDKKPINPMIAYQYGMSDALLQPIWIKSEKEDIYRISGEAFYKQHKLRQERKNQVVTEVLVLHDEKPKADRVWEGLMSDLIEHPHMYDDKAVYQIKSMISVAYLKRLKAVPRPSDLHRYAVSLFYIVKHDLHNRGQDIPLDALEEEYLR